MKTKILFILASLAAITGCELIQDAATVSIPTRFKTEIPIVISSYGVKSSETISANAPISFTETQDLYIADNMDVEPYLEKIKTIKLNEVVVTVKGLKEGQAINSISLDVAGVGNIITKTGITMANNTFTPVIPATVFEQVAQKLKDERKIRITVSGNVSEPLSITVGLDIDADVVAYLLK